MLRAIREAVEGFVFDPSVVDVVLWFPHLTWLEFATSLTAVLCWRWVADRIERAAMLRARRAASRLLLRLAILLRPRPQGAAHA